MKSLKESLNESLVKSAGGWDKINAGRNDKYQGFEFKSHVTNNPKNFEGQDFIVDEKLIQKFQISILIDLATKAIDSGLLTKEDKAFVRKWRSNARVAYKFSYEENENPFTFDYACNGNKPYFGNAKLTYDLIQFGLSCTDTTIPRRAKLEKMKRELYREVERYADQMNWY